MLLSSKEDDEDEDVVSVSEKVDQSGELGLFGADDEGGILSLCPEMKVDGEEVLGREVLMCGTDGAGYGALRIGCLPLVWRCVGGRRVRLGFSVRVTSLWVRRAWEPPRRSIADFRNEEATESYQTSWSMFGSKSEA